MDVMLEVLVGVQKKLKKIFLLLKVAGPAEASRRALLAGGQLLMTSLHRSFKVPQHLSSTKFKLSILLVVVEVLVSFYSFYSVPIIILSEQECLDGFTRSVQVRQT
jgi:hypothetical protein